MQLDLQAAISAGLAGHYTVSDRVGHGGMAEVYRAHDLRHDRDVAVKVLHPELARAIGGDRFLREIGIQARLSHPNILPLLDSGSITLGDALDLPWYAMPFVEEETLRGLLRREGPLPLSLAVQYTTDICAALAHAHTHGYIHRDIKPENILLSGGRAVVADFGIARAVSLAAGDEVLSSTGLVVGTPVYMSPEQSVGAENVDARTDVYSAGVVLYEMLAGHPPFSGGTPQAISARHQFEPPPPISIVRPGLPAQVQEVVERALAKVPGDRFQTAGALAEALQKAALAPAEQRSRPRTFPWRLLGGGIVLLGALWGVNRALTREKVLDPSRYVVLPFQGPPSSRVGAVSSADCAELISASLDRWADLSVVSSLTIASALEMAGRPLDLAGALGVARRFGAGRVIWGELVDRGDSVGVRGVLYDAGSGEEINHDVVWVAAAAPDLAGLANAFVRLTLDLVGPSGAPDAAPDAPGTHTFAAWRAYTEGDSALDQWALQAALARYRRALDIDPGFPQANLMAAQVAQWLDLPVSAWRSYAERAAAEAARLTPSHRLMARGLLALADGDFPGACDHYRRMVEADTLDFFGWFGLGECQASDKLVEPDSTSPTGWRFRSSFQSATDAYLHALRLAPAVHRAAGVMAIGKLSDVMYTSRRLRDGASAAPDSQGFVAWQGLEHDTLSFLPFALRAALKTGGPDPPASASRALARNRQELLDLSAEWVRDFPQSASAWTQRSHQLELNGELVGPTGFGALDAIQRARALESDSAPAVEAMVDQVRILIKLGRFADARALADSALTRGGDVTSDEATPLASLAALTGRARRVGELLQRAANTWEFVTPEGQMTTLPGMVARPALALYTTAIMGQAADSFRVLERAVQRGIEAVVPPGDRQAATHAALDGPSEFGFPVVGPRPVHDDWKASANRVGLQRQWLLSHHEWDALRNSLAEEVRLRHTQTETFYALSPEDSYARAYAWLVIGDTASAIGELDEELDNLGLQGLNLLLYPHASAFLVREIALHAEVSLAVGDTTVAARWARAAATLWAEADADLRGVTRRMQAIATLHDEG